MLRTSFACRRIRYLHAARGSTIGNQVFRTLLALLFITVLYHTEAKAHRVVTDTIQPKRVAIPQQYAPKYMAGNTRSFSQLQNIPHSFHALSAKTDLMGELFKKRLAQTKTKTPANVQDWIKKAHDLLEKVTGENRFVSLLKPQTLAELPVGIKRTIGNVEYVVVIDSVILTPTGASLVAYMSLGLPDTQPTDQEAELKTGEEGGEKPVTKQRRLAFRGTNIHITSTGGITNAKLHLLEDFPMDIGNSLLTLKGGENESYVSFDCNGFQQLGLSAELDFSRDWLIPENPDGSRSTDPNQRVKGRFKADIKSWSDLLAKVSFDQTFQVKALNGFGFRVTNAIFDFSDLRNSPDFRLPEGYPTGSPDSPGTPDTPGGEDPVFPTNPDDPGLPGGPGGTGLTAITGNQVELWRGVFISEVTVLLPPQFNKGEAQARTSFTGRDVLIDKTGFSGTFIAQNLIAGDEGKMGKWFFSVDYFEMSFLSNEVQYARFNGGLKLPITSGFVSYDGMIDPIKDEYLFHANYSKPVDVPLWLATMTFDPSSVLEVSVKDKHFIAKATLNGKLTIGKKKTEGQPVTPGTPDEPGAPGIPGTPSAPGTPGIPSRPAGSTVADKEKVESDSKFIYIPDMRFEQLVIQTEKPYIDLGNFSAGSEVDQTQLGKYPVEIQEIRTVRQTDADGTQLFGLKFKAGVNLVGGSSSGKSKSLSFKGEGGFTVWGVLEEGTISQKFVYKDLDIDKVLVDVDAGAFKLMGSVEFYKEDLTFGDGFKGMMDVRFGPENMGVELQGAVMFGNVNNMRYWYADAMATLPTGIPLTPEGSIKFYGFGGGAYYKMAPAGFEENAASSSLGYTPSGITYLPNKDAFLGLKASVVLGGPTLETYKIKATFEMTLNNSGGLKYIGFRGRATFLNVKLPVPIALLRDQVQRLADVASKMKFPDGLIGDQLNKLIPESSSGNLNTGSGENGTITADAAIDYDVDNKTLHGNLNVNINVAGGVMDGGGQAVFHVEPGKWYVHIGTPENRIKLRLLGLAETGAYFMTGNSIPEMPAPPRHILDVLKEKYPESREEMSLLNGGGVVFGANLGVNTGDLSFLVFYGKFQGDAGFDVMLKKYGDNVRCVGREGTVGINGWYAQGQAYAGLNCEIGIKVNLFGSEKRYEILKMGAGALLQAKLPNPAWMKGTVGGYFSILGGLVKGDCRFEVTLGEPCQLVGGTVLSGVSVVSELTPTNQSQQVDVFASPQAVFNLPVDKPFEMVDIDEIKKTYRIKLNHFTLTVDNQPVAGNLEWNDDHTVLAFKPSEVLAPQKAGKVEVKVSFEEQVNGVWKAVKDVSEVVASDFVSGDAPAYIPMTNVAYAYPSVNQRNYLTKESNKGYIKLSQGQAYLFALDTQKWKKQVLRIQQVGAETPLEVPVTYNAAAKEVQFTMPDNLDKSRVYQVDLVNIPNDSKPIDENVSKKTQTLGDNDEVTINTKSLDGLLSDAKVTSILGPSGYHFRTSEYTTFAKKMAGLETRSKWKEFVYPQVDRLGLTVQTSEIFDRNDLLGTANAKPLIQVESRLDSRWYSREIYPLVYEKYPYNNSVNISWRNAATVGTPPVYGTQLRQDVETKTLGENEITTGQAVNMPSNAAFIYNIPYYAERDFRDLQNQAVNRLTLGISLSNDEKSLINGQFSRITYGSYDVTVKYILPGATEPTSTKKITIYNPIKD